MSRPRIPFAPAALLGLLAACTACAGPQDRSPAPASTYRNPLLPSGADPWVVRRDGFYYYLNTLGDRIAIRKTLDLSQLARAEPVTVWRPPARGPNSTSIWAPELHVLDGRWFLYYTAADKAHDDDDHRHVFVLENDGADPTQGRWIDRGMLETRHTGIDGTVFRHRGALYFVYSAYVGDHSDLVIARMRDPWTLSTTQVDIARPTYAWEMQGGRRILEGPEFLAGPGDTVFLVYSASACWSDDYALGMLQASAGADLTDPASWRKSPEPVFAKSPAHGIYATGHNAFFKSPDGRQDWILYHANGGPGLGCSAKRAPRMQRFGWKPDGSPDFGVPVRDGVALPAPSGAGGH